MELGLAVAILPAGAVPGIPLPGHCPTAALRGSQPRDLPVLYIFILETFFNLMGKNWTLVFFIRETDPALPLNKWLCCPASVRVQAAEQGPCSSASPQGQLLYEAVCQKALLLL